MSIGEVYIFPHNKMMRYIRDKIALDMTELRTKRNPHARRQRLPKSDLCPYASPAASAVSSLFSKCAVVS